MKGHNIYFQADSLTKFSESPLETHLIQSSVYLCCILEHAACEIWKPLGAVFLENI